MPMVRRTANHWERASKRILHIGPPNTWKTTALATYPRPIHYICCPGEQGHGTMPEGDGITAYLWDPSSTDNYRTVIEEMENTVANILAGKNGPVTTLAIDGLHKLCMLYTLKEASGSLDTVPEEEMGRTYGRGNSNFFKWLIKVLESDVQYVACTVWDAYEKDDSQDRSKKAPQHIFPALPGQAAKKIIGEFGICLYHEPDQLEHGKINIRTAPGGKIWGCGVKMPMAIAKTIPALILAKDWQGWPTLERLIFPATQESTNG